MSRILRGSAAFTLLVSLTALSALAADEPQRPGLPAGTDVAGEEDRIPLRQAQSRLRPARAIRR